MEKLVYALYQSGGRFKVFMNKAGDTDNKIVFNELASDTIEVWEFVTSEADINDLADSMSVELDMPIMKVAKFLDNFNKIAPKDFGTYKQWRAIAFINERDGRNFAPQTYEELSNILENNL